MRKNQTALADQGFNNWLVILGALILDLVFDKQLFYSQTPVV